MSAGLPRGAIALALAVSVAALAYDPSAAAAEPKRVLLLLVALATLGFCLTRSAALGASKAAWAWVALSGWSTVSLLWGNASGLRDLGTWIAGAALIASASFLRDKDRKTLAGLASLLVGGGASLLALVQLLSGARGIFVHGGEGNGNWLGLLLAVSLPLAIDCVWRSWKDAAPWLRASGVASVALQSVSLLLSHSRVAWIALAIALIAWVMTSRTSLAKRAAAVACAVSLLVVVAWTGRGAPAAGSDRLAPPADVQVGTAWEGRVWIWQTSAHVARESLPLGTGMGRFSQRYLEAQGTRLGLLEPKMASRKFANAQTAHNDWIQVLAETGPLGLLLLALGWLWALQSSWRMRWGGSVASLVALAVCAWGDSPLRQPAIVALLCLSLGALPAQWQVKVSAFRWGAVAASVGTALLLACATSGWIASRWVTRARAEASEQSLLTLQQARRVDPRSGEAAFALGIAWLEAGNPQLAIQHLEESKPLLANVGTDIAIGNAWMQASRYASAVDAYRSAITLHPGAFRAHANVAEALRVSGRLDEARHHLAIAKALWPGNPHLPELEERLRESSLDQEREVASAAPLP